jgi:hypothetical protein
LKWQVIEEITRQSALGGGQQHVGHAGDRFGVGHAGFAVDFPSIQDQAHARVEHTHAAAAVAHRHPRLSLVTISATDRDHRRSDLKMKPGPRTKP